MLATSVGFLGPAAAAAVPTMIAALHGATAVEAYGDVAVWSDYDATDRSWHLVVRRDGQISMPSIPAAGKAIEADVGPGPSGSPMLAYVNCASICHVVVSGVDGSAPRTVTGSDGASHPTIWGDRVAWVSGNIGAVGTTTEVRTEAVLGGPQRLVALLDVGEGDESWLGPSWSNGKLYFYEDSMGAGFVVYRFDPARDTYLSARAHTYLTGFSVVGERAYEATASGDPRAGNACLEEEVEPCVVRLSEPFAFKPSRAPVHVP
jgi:hypothetical protein